MLVRNCLDRFLVKIDIFQLISYLKGKDFRQNLGVSGLSKIRIAIIGRFSIFAKFLANFWKKNLKTGQMSCNWSLLLGKHDFWAKICSRAKIDRGGGSHPPLSPCTWQGFQMSPSLGLNKACKLDQRMSHDLALKYIVDSFPLLTKKPSHILSKLNKTLYLIH